MWRFGPFELDVQARQLRRGGLPLPLRDRAVEVLLALLEQAGQIVSKQALCRRAWPQWPVDDNNLQVEISALRKLIGADAIVTAAGRGYQFAWPVCRDAAPLPPLEPVLFGRGDELAAVEAGLVLGGLVTLTGEPGSGKSALARAVAARWTAASGLLVLDGGEQVAGPVAAWAVAAQGQGQALLVSCRELLHLPGERVVRLGPLDAAVDLFFHSLAAGAVLRPTVAEAQTLCDAVEGHPLAIESAAQWVAEQGMAPVLAALQAPGDAGLHMLMDAAPRLRASFQSAWKHLGAAEQALMRALATRPSPFTLAQLPPTATLDLLGRLVDRSMLVVRGGDPPGFAVSLVMRAAMALPCCQTSGRVPHW